MGLTLALNSAVTGLSTAQAQLNVVSNNIANVNTTGYTRKLIDQQTLVLAGQGAGVNVGQVYSNVDQNLLQTMRNENSDLGASTVVDNYLGQVADTFGSTSDPSSIATQINNLAQQFTTFSTDPTTPTSQQQLLQSAESTATDLNSLGNTIQNLRVNADRDISTAVTQINGYLQTISTLNDQIALNQATSRGTADLEDQRDDALNSLSQLIDIRYYTNSNGTDTVFTTDGTTLVDSSPTNVSHTPLTIVTASNSYAAGNFNAITVGVRDITNSIRSGQLKGLINLRDNILPDMQSQVDQLSSSLQQQVNQVSNRGTSFPTEVNNVTGSTQFLSPSTETVSFSGGETNVVLFDTNGNEVASSRVDDPNGINFTNGGTLSDLASDVQTWVQAQDPQLANATVGFNAQGQLAINLGTDQFGIGFQDEQTTTKGSPQQDVSVGLDIDGDGQIDQTSQGFSNFFGLNDIFTSTPNLSQWSSGLLPTNYGMTTTSPSTLSIINSANPTGIPGGTITVNPGDSLQNIADAINNNSSLQGVVSASVVPEAGGQRLQITSSLGRQIAVTQQGGTNAITALGLSQSDAGVAQTIAVNPTLVADPSRIAAGAIQLNPQTGTFFLANADNTTALQLASLMTNQVAIPAAGSLPAGNITLADYAGSIVSTASNLQATNKATMQQQSDLQSALAQKQSQQSGVNLDQEMSQLMIFQNSYAASAKVISATKQMFDILNGLIS